jgi:hypothetical protein
MEPSRLSCSMSGALKVGDSISQMTGPALLSRERRSTFMMQRSLGFPLLSVCLVLSLVSCASAPPASAPGSKASGQKAAGPSSINLLCHEGARAVRFDKMGVPDGERPVDIALTRGSVWVLFDSGRLLRTGRGGEHLEVQMQFLPVKAEVGAIAVDPLDDSIWVVSNSSLSLYHLIPGGQLTVVKLQRKVEGAGGFAGLIAARDALYAQPTCADSAVWRVDRSGRLLGMAFNVPPRPENEPDVVSVNGKFQGSCYALRLERDLQGHILAWDGEKRATFQVDDQGNWAPSQSSLFAHFTDMSFGRQLKGVNVGERSEQWYFVGVSGNLFFWKGRPVFVGSHTAKEKSQGNDTVLYLPGEDETREVIMPCNGFAVRRVAADGTGYAALTDRFLILGDLAGAPDLP